MGQIEINYRNKVNFFWHNPDNNVLDEVAQLCINSAVYHGHYVNLWTYGNLEIGKLDMRVHLCAASDVIKKDEFFSAKFKGFKHSNSFFSNYFRFKLLDTHAGWWSDTDVVFLKNISYLAVDYGYVVGTEDYKNKLPVHACGLIYSSPWNNVIIKDTLSFVEERIEKYNKTGKLPKWAETSVVITSKLINSGYDPGAFSYPRSVMYEAGWKQKELKSFAYEPLWKQSDDTVKRVLNNDQIAVSHLWNSLVDFNKVHKDSYFGIMLEILRHGEIPSKNTIMEIFLRTCLDYAHRAVEEQIEAI